MKISAEKRIFLRGNLGSSSVIWDSYWVWPGIFTAEQQRVKYPQENTCLGDSFLTETLLKKKLQHRCFPVNFAEFLRKPFDGCFSLLYNFDVKVTIDSLSFLWITFHWLNSLLISFLMDCIPGQKKRKHTHPYFTWTIFWFIFLSPSFYPIQNMKFSIKDFFSKCDQIRRKLWIWSHLLKKSSMENFIFCAVLRFTDLN